MNNFQKGAITLTLCLIAAVGFTAYTESNKCVVSKAETNALVATNIDYSKYNW